MYKIKVIKHFSAAHFLRNYKGKCEALHGHNWKVEVSVSSSKLNSLGMVIDFSDLKKMTSNVLEELDHSYINEIDYFSAKGACLPARQGSASGGKGHNPSSEEIAKYIFDKLKPAIIAAECELEKVRIWETDSSSAVYQK